MNEIPEYNGEWKQPTREEITIDKTHALMSKDTFYKLSPLTPPAPRVAGQMWVSSDQCWWLHWVYHKDGQNYVASRKILIA